MPLSQYNTSQFKTPQFNNTFVYSPEDNKKSDTPETTDKTKQNSVFSYHDNNKNGNIELSDNSAINFINQQQNIQETTDANIKSKINVKELFSETIKSSFKSFNYDTSKPSVISVDCEVSRNLSSQATSINQTVTEKYNQMVEQTKEQIQKELDEFANDAKSLREDYDAATISYKLNKENDGFWEKSANYISYAWASDNTYEKVSKDLESFKSKLDQLDSAVQSGDYETQKTLVSELKSKDIYNRVDDFNKSQDKGGAVVQTVAEVAAVTAVTVATGGLGTVGTVAVGGTIGFGAEYLDKVTAEKPMDSDDWVDIAVNTGLGAIPVGGKTVNNGLKTVGKTFFKGAIKTGVEKSSMTAMEKVIQKFGEGTVKQAQKYISKYGEKVAVQMLEDMGVSEAKGLVSDICLS